MLLRGTCFYSTAASAFHVLKNFSMRFSLLFSDVKYLPPRKPEGNYKSQFGQDYYLEKFGLISKNGFFVEVGCNHPIFNSNSYYLEKHLLFSGVSIDGIDYSAEYSELRSKTKFLNILIDKHIGELDFYIVKNVDGWENQVSSIHRATLSMGKGFKADVKRLRTSPISAIEEINRPIDLCLIDVEGHELQVLDSINWTINAPSVVVVENNGEFYPRKKLVRYMTGRNYRHFARIGSSDDIFVSYKFIEKL